MPAPEFTIKRKRDSPCKVELSAAGFNVAIAFESMLDENDVQRDTKRCKAVCADLILKCMYPDEHEIAAATEAFQETEITQLDPEDAELSEAIEKHRANKLAHLEGRQQKIDESPDNFTEDAINKTKDQYEKFSAFGESREFCEYESLNVFVKPYADKNDTITWFWYTQEFGKFLKLEDEWEMAKVDDTEDTWHVTVSVHQRDMETSELTFLFSVEHEADFSHVPQKIQRGSRNQEIAKQLRAEAGKKYMIQLVARSMVPSNDREVIETCLQTKREEYKEAHKDDKKELAYQKERNIKLYEAREKMDESMGIKKTSKKPSSEVREKFEAKQAKQVERKKEHSRKRNEKRNEKRKEAGKSEAKVESPKKSPTKKPKRDSSQGEPKRERSRGGQKQRNRQDRRNGQHNGGQNGGGAYYPPAAQVAYVPTGQQWVAQPQAYQMPMQQNGGNNFSGGQATGSQWAQSGKKQHNGNLSSFQQNVVQLQKQQMAQMQAMHRQQMEAAGIYQ